MNVNVSPLVEAKTHSDVLWHFIDETTQSVKIHINNKQSKDYSRTMFVLSVLARGVQYGIVSKVKQESLCVIFWHMYAFAAANLPPRQMQYVDLYGMRFLHNLKQDYSSLVVAFANRSHQDLFTYPVLTYIFGSAYNECSALRELYPFSQSLYYETLKTFDWILRSNTRMQYQPFHFSELSAWTGDEVAQIRELAYQYIDHCFESGYLTKTRTSASGVAKCMEDFARRGQSEKFLSCSNFLNTRLLARFKNYVRPDQTVLAFQLYTETKDTQYICLDTNAHLLNSYLNIYEKQVVS